MNDPAHVSLHVDDVKVDAEEVVVHWRHGEMPRVRYVTFAQGDVQGVYTDSPNASEVVLAFLEDVDPGELEEEALARIESFDDRTPGDYMLEILKERARAWA